MKITIDFKQVLKVILCFAIGFLFGFFVQNKIQLDEILCFLFQAVQGVSLTAFFAAVFFVMIRYIITGK